MKQQKSPEEEAPELDSAKNKDGSPEQKEGDPVEWPTAEAETQKRSKRAQLEDILNKIE